MPEDSTNKSIVGLNDLGRHYHPLQQVLNTAIGRVTNSGNYILGKWVGEFEKTFASYCQTAYAIGVANGTDALLLSLLALDLKKGDEVITVANAGGYATNAILRSQATPHYADIDPASFLMTAATMKKALTRNARAVIVTHLYGQMAEMEAICALAEQHGIVVIEDCAQAHGAALGGRKAGSWGRVGCFSFYPTKNLGAIGDAGCIVTQDEALSKRLRSLRHYGWQDIKYHNPNDIGINSRMDELQASLLCELLPYLDSWNSKRRHIVQHYREGLRGLPLKSQHPGSGSDYVAHLYVVCTPLRDQLRLYLDQQGIRTDIHYPVADYDQHAFICRLGRQKPLPNTKQIQKEIITLPCFPELSDIEIEYVIKAIRDFFDRHHT